jgi:hypothetical protein
MMAAGALRTFGTALIKLTPLLAKLTMWLSAIIVVGGGVENTLRQVGESFKEILRSVWGGLSGLMDLIDIVTTLTVDLVQGIISLTSSLLNLIPGVNITSGSLDLLKVALIPVTATLQLFEMGIKGLVEGLMNVRLWLLKMTNWGGRNDAKIKEAEASVTEATQSQNESKRRIDVYNTAMRYGGAGNYAKVLEKDVAAKQAKLNKEGLLKAEREKLNNELNALNKTLAEARKQAGESTGGPVTKPGEQPKNKPGDQRSGTPTPGQTPVAASPTPPAPAPSLAPVTTAVTGTTTAVTGTTTAVNTVGANVRTASTALQNVTTATQATQLATQGITPGLTALHTAFQTFVSLFTTTSTEQATRDTKTQALLNSIIIGNNSIRSALMVISNKVSPLAKIESNTSETNVLLKTINTSIKGISLMGGMMPGGFSPPLGGAQGSLKQAASMASANGLTLTSSFRPGDPGYHGVGRAMDFSNSTGPTPQMMEFANQMIAQYGSSLTELIYSPLGFSIKNGKKVAPLAYGAHFNHVHVAFARGLENPRLFTTAQAAMAYESMAMPAGAKVQSITANSSENLGGHYTVNQNITISGAQDPRKLAEMVFNYAAQAAEHVNNSSFA